MKLPNVQLSPFSRYFSPLRSKYSPQHPVLKHPQYSDASGVRLITRSLSKEIHIYNICSFHDDCKQERSTVSVRTIFPRSGGNLWLLVYRLLEQYTHIQQVLRLGVDKSAAVSRTFFLHSVLPGVEVCAQSFQMRSLHLAS
jgi:hypothetical protein